MNRDNSSELFPVVDETGRVVGCATRGECHDGRRLLHPVVHLHLFNSRGELYLQKRPLWKDIQPGRWDTAVGGHVDYGEGVFVGYRYYDTYGKAVDYPFGYGLSYTTFEYSDLDITPRVITPNESATVRLKVTNTGKRAGDEVVQLYIRDVLSSITTYEKNLAGFQRIHLEPGEAQELSFTIDRKHLELLDADMKWVVEPGDFVLMAGASSEDIRLNGTLTVEDYQTRAKAIEAQKPAKRVSASTNPEDAENVLDEKINTAWQGNKGDYITFALKNGAKVDKVAIAFTRDNNLPATFEIQLSGGGGQFLTVYSGTVSEYGKLISYPFKGTTASDLRIVLNDDRVSIAEVKF